ncbi:MAG TPA: YegP family protein [Luteolibacter sp.]|nr:YegP family protein [Luteolibacter sp.]
MSYEIKTDAAGKFRFNLKAGNGQVILSSQGYADKAGVEGGIASCQANGPLEESYERKDSVKGEPYFVLKAKNGQIIGQSEMYSAVAARETGIESVKKNSPSTTIKEV